MALVPAASTALVSVGGTALQAGVAAADASASSLGSVVALCCAVGGVAYAYGASSWKRRRVVEKEVTDVKQENDKLRGDLAVLQGQVLQMQNQLNDVRGNIGGVENRMGSVQGAVECMQSQVGGVQGLARSIHGDVARVQGQMDGVQSVVGKVNGLQAHVQEMQGSVARVQGRVEDVQSRVDEVGRVQEQIDDLAARADQNARSVDRLRGDTNLLASRMGQAVRGALSDGLNALADNVNHALENRMLGMGPRVQNVQVGFVGHEPALTVD